MRFSSGRSTPLRASRLSHAMIPSPRIATKRKKCSFSEDFMRESGASSSRGLRNPGTTTRSQTPEERGRNRREDDRHLRAVKTSNITCCGGDEERNTEIRRWWKNLDSLHRRHRKIEMLMMVTVRALSSACFFRCPNPPRSIRGLVRIDGTGSQRVRARDFTSTTTQSTC